MIVADPSRRILLCELDFLCGVFDVYGFMSREILCVLFRAK